MVALDLGLKWIAFFDLELISDRNRKNNLAFAGDFRLHGKTVLPYFRRRTSETLHGNNTHR